MSSFKKSSLISELNIDELVDGALGGIESLIDAMFGDNEDPYNNQTEFRAVVITNPKTIEAHEYKALGFSGSENDMDQGKFKKFKVRITHKQNNPHAILQDPCDITTASDRCYQNALIALHTTVVSEKHHGINIGAYVTIRLQRHSSGIYNLQTAELVNVLHPNSTGNTTLTQETCNSIRAYFTYGEAYEPPPPIEMPSELRALAELYDTTSDIPGKAQHARFLNPGSLDAVKKPFDIWLKALLYSAYDAGFGEVLITSGYRDPAKQEQLHQERKAAKARGEDVLPASCGFCPTRSRHTFGMAVDLNFTDQNGNFINSKSDKILWDPFVRIATGPPMFLRWGGNFNRYDPVHFDLNPPSWGKNAQQYFDSMVDGQVDTISTGGLTPNEQYEQVQDSLPGSDGTSRVDNETAAEIRAAATAANGNKRGYYGFANASEEEQAATEEIGAMFDERITE